MFDSKKAVSYILNEEKEQQAMRRIVWQAQKEQPIFPPKKMIGGQERWYHFCPLSFVIGFPYIAQTDISLDTTHLSALLILMTNKTVNCVKIRHLTGIAAWEKRAGHFAHCQNWNSDVRLSHHIIQILILIFSKCSSAGSGLHIQPAPIRSDQSDSALKFRYKAIQIPYNQLRFPEIAAKD